MLPPARLAARGYAGSSHPASRIIHRIATAGIATSPEHPPPRRSQDGQVGVQDHSRKPRGQPNRPNAAGPFQTQREKAGLGRANVGPSSPMRFWPKFEIPSAAKLIECDFEGLRGGPVTVGWTTGYLYVQDKRNEAGRRALKPLTIRDSCCCAKCRDPVSGQKTFSTTEIPLNTGIADVRATEDGLALTWTADIPRVAESGHHETLVPWSAVELALQRPVVEDPPLPRKRNLTRHTGVVYWDRGVLESQVRTVDYGAFMSDDAAHWDVVIDLLRLGIVFLANVPRDEDAVLRIVERIANVRETFYGRTFDVRAKPAADNVAYTAAALAPHQDLAYLDPQPLVQVLHALDNSCAGGDSLFSDGERVGRLLYPFVCESKRMAPLADQHIPFHYVKNGFRYFASRHVIETNEGGFANITWSPPFQGTNRCPTRDLRPWIPAARVFEAMVADPAAVYTRKLHEGECVLFDNQRVLHGRTAFDPAAGGQRWLRGAYIAADDFLSKASHMPLDRAAAARGHSQWWSPSAAQAALRSTAWHKDALRRVREIDPRFQWAPNAGERGKSAVAPGAAQTTPQNRPTDKEEEPLEDASAAGSNQSI